MSNLLCIKKTQRLIYFPRSLRRSLDEILLNTVGFHFCTRLGWFLLIFASTGYFLLQKHPCFTSLDCSVFLTVKMQIFNNSCEIHTTKDYGNETEWNHFWAKTRNLHLMSSSPLSYRNFRGRGPRSVSKMSSKMNRQCVFLTIISWPLPFS